MCVCVCQLLGGSNRWELLGPVYYWWIWTNGACGRLRHVHDLGLDDWGTVHVWGAVDDCGMWMTGGL